MLIIIFNAKNPQTAKRLDWYWWDTQESAGTSDLTAANVHLSRGTAERWKKKEEKNKFKEYCVTMTTYSLHWPVYHWGVNPLPSQKSPSIRSNYHALDVRHRWRVATLIHQATPSPPTTRHVCASIFVCYKPSKKKQLTITIKERVARSLSQCGDALHWFTSVYRSSTSQKPTLRF